MSYAYWEQSGVRQDDPAPQADHTPSADPAGPARRQKPKVEPVQIFAGIVGATFLLVGILGFIPGVTTNYDELSLIGTDSKAELLGLFQVSVVHNIVHLLFGVGVLAARKASTATTYLIVGGVGYALVGLYGSVIDHGSDANFLPINSADNILHFALAAGMILLGVVGAMLLRRNEARPAA